MGFHTLCVRSVFPAAVSTRCIGGPRPWFISVALAKCLDLLKLQRHDVAKWRECVMHLPVVAMRGCGLWARTFPQPRLCAHASRLAPFYFPGLVLPSPPPSPCPTTTATSQQNHRLKQPSVAQPKLTQSAGLRGGHQGQQRRPWRTPCEQFTAVLGQQKEPAHQHLHRPQLHHHGQRAGGHLAHQG